MVENLKIIPATRKDISTVFSFIQGLANHVNLSHEIKTTEEELENTLFNQGSHGEIFLCFINDQAVAIAICLPSFSTFLGKPGLYIEDLLIISDYGDKQINSINEDLLY